MTLAAEVVAKLGKPLDPARIRHREGGGGRSLSYLEGHDAIRAANEVFGVGGWSYRATDLTCLGEEPVVKTYNGQTREGFRVAYRATVCVSVEDTYYEDVGFGDAMEYTGSKLTPHELASKEAVTDALKRALKNFGDQFGLCLYDKAYVPGAPGTGATNGLQGSASVGGQAAASSPHPSGSAAATTTSDGWTWPFGKHKGKTLADTPAEYLGWFLEKSDKEDIKQRIREFQTVGALAETGGSFYDADDPDSDVPF